MKHRAIIVTIFIILFQCQVFGQENWDIYTFGNICSFRIPPTMELRDIDSEAGMVLNKLVNNFSIRFGENLADREIKFQPKGLNSTDKELVKKATSVYSRIIIADLNGDFPTQSDIAKATNNEIKEIDAIFKNQAIESFSLFGLGQTIKWFPLKRVRIDGKYALRSMYKRPSPKGGFVNVREYMFFFTDHLVRITVSYRESESSLWKKDLDTFLSSLRFN